MSEERKADAESGPSELPMLCRQFIEYSALPMAAMEGAPHIIRHANPAFCVMVGSRNKEDLIGKPFAEAVPKADQWLVSCLDRVRRTGEPETHTDPEAVGHHPLYGLFSLWPVHAADGRVVGIVFHGMGSADILQRMNALAEGLMLAAVRNHELKEEADRLRLKMETEIAERKQVEAQRLVSLRELKNLKAAVDEHDIIVITDPQGAITYVNDRFCALSKYPREELMGRNPRILNSGYHPKEFIRNLWETIGHGRIWKGKFRNRAKDGSIFWLETTIVPFLDASGKPYQYLAIRTDITELKRVEEALRESERQLLTLMNNLPGMAYRRCNDRDWTMEFVSNGAQALTGYSASELIGNRMVSYASLIHPEDRETVWEQVQAALNRREPFVLNYRVRTATGEEHWVWEQGQGVFDAQDQLLALEGFIVNITKLKQTEEALKESKEAAEAANRAKDQFIAVLSHELRTPLTPVLATVSAFQPQKQLPVDLSADMELIRRNVEMEAMLIDDLLDVTRISRGKIDIHQEVVDVHASLGMTVEICQEEIKAKRLEIRLEFHAEQHHAWADPVRLRQVFWNLLKNAVKFTPEGGGVTLRTSNDGDRLKIEVSDTGIGIEPDVLPRIFNLFEQGELGRMRQFGGLGLGLHIARAVVEMHQGRLTAFSEGRNKGARFTVELAAIAPPEKAETPSPTVEPQEGPLRILLVEDHPDTLLVLAKLLKKWGHAVTTAGTAKKAQELAAGQEFDLLISDLGLPDGSGLDVMRQVKARSAIPGIALSGYGTEEDIRQSKAAGFSGHLVKPVNIAALRTALREFASRVPPV